MPENIKKTSLFALYWAGVAACYLAAFWGSFDIDVFQFAGLTDFAKLAIYPLMVSAGANLMGLLLSEARSIDRPHLNAEYVDPPLKIWLHRRRRGVLFSTTVLAAIVLISNHEPFRWVVVAILVVPWAVQIEEHPLVRSLIPGDRLRLGISIWALAAPCLALTIGQVNARAILQGVEARTVQPTGIASTLHEDADHPIGYVGFIGGTYVLYESKTDSVVLLKQSDNQPLTLKTNARPDAYAAIKGWFARLHSR